MRRTRNSTPRHIASAVWKSGWCSTRRMAADNASSTRPISASWRESREGWMKGPTRRRISASTEASSASGAAGRPTRRAKSDSRAWPTSVPRARRGGGGSGSSPPQASTCLAARSKLARLPRLRRRVRSSPNRSRLSASWSGWKSSIAPISTSTVPPSSSIGRLSLRPMRAMTSSRLSTSTLIGLRLARASPVSRRPALARPEKSPSRARRNFCPAVAGRAGRFRRPKLTAYSMLALRIGFEIIPVALVQANHGVRPRQSGLRGSGHEKG